MNRRGTVDGTLPRTPPAPAPREHQPPQRGDLIISRQAAPGAFGISRYPETVQLSISREDAARDLAHGFARRYGVDVWERRGDTCALVGSYRQRA